MNLFVYGTLAPGGAQNWMMAGEPMPVFTEPLWQIREDWPFVRLVRGNGCVPGHWYQVPEERLVLSDKINRGLFERWAIRVAVPGGFDYFAAQAYVFVGPSGPFSIRHRK